SMHGTPGCSPRMTRHTMTKGLDVGVFLTQCYGHPPPLHSFPTRRSSDLPSLHQRSCRRFGRLFMRQSVTKRSYRRSNESEITWSSEEHRHPLHSLGQLVGGRELEKTATGSQPIRSQTNRTSSAAVPVAYL